MGWPRAQFRPRPRPAADPTLSTPRQCAPESARRDRPRNVDGSIWLKIVMRRSSRSGRHQCRARLARLRCAV